MVPGRYHFSSFKEEKGLMIQIRIVQWTKLAFIYKIHELNYHTKHNV